ncbi:MAG TPA: hypothetical protein VJ729_15935 [Nitrososphaeraceae archaeon]|nr:hypothetical protein [Nitrososphaeraceae archaeon]
MTAVNQENVITSSSDWDKLHASNSFVPKYKEGKALNDPNAEIFIWVSIMQMQ